MLGSADFKMQMHAGNFARRAHIADNLAALDELAFRGEERREVAIERLRTVVVRDDEIVAVAAVPTAFAGNDNLT